MTRTVAVTTRAAMNRIPQSVGVSPEKERDTWLRRRRTRLDAKIFASPLRPGTRLGAGWVTGAPEAVVGTEASSPGADCPIVMALGRRE